MAKQSTVTISIQILGDGATLGEVQQVVNAASPGSVAAVILNTGFTSLAVPTGATGMLLIPAATSVVVKTLKGIGGDTGVTLAPASPTFLGLGAGVTSVGIQASAGETVTLVWT